MSSSLSASGGVPALGHIFRSIERRGRVYMIKDPVRSEDDDVVNGGNTSSMIDDLYHDALEMSSRANRIASLHKMIYTFCTFLIIIGGITVTIISIGKNDYTTTVIGAVITGIQTIVTTFSIERRGVLLRDTANKARAISRKCRALQISDLKEETKMHRIEDLYAEVDELDMNIFDNNITSSKPSKVTLSKGRRGDSDLNSKDDVTTMVTNKPILPVTTSDVQT